MEDQDTEQQLILSIESAITFQFNNPGNYDIGVNMKVKSEYHDMLEKGIMLVQSCFNLEGEVFAG